MTPLELLAVGVIMVVTWFLGFGSGRRYTTGQVADWMTTPVWLGLVLWVYALVWLLILGIKEATK